MYGLILMAIQKDWLLTPIYKTLPNAMDRSPDENFYAIISALDLIRLSGKRENKIAKELLEQFVWNQ